MSELSPRFNSEPTPEQPKMTEAQEAALQDLCSRYGVEYSAEHYAPRFDLPADYVAGWVGGYEIQESQPTIYVGCDGEGRISS